MQGMLGTTNGSTMETTPHHATIINRQSPNKQTTRADQDRRSMTEISKFDPDHDWLGPLVLKRLYVTRQVVDLKDKQLGDFPIWHMIFE